MSKDKVSHLRIIGDCHGKYDQYLHLAKESTYSLCVGDVGFEYSYFERLLDPEFGKFIGGNHDNYCKQPCCKDGCEKCENRGFTFTKLSRHFLKDFGVWEVPDFGSIFYVRGAWSIDQDWRIRNVSWWEDEELTYQQCVNAIELYEKLKPEFVVTHTVPESVIPSVPFNKMFGDTIRGSRTEQMLENMYQIHQPLRWIFGHWHVDWKKWFEHPKTSKKTEFICLKELGCMDFQKKIPDDAS
jgi:hypothetical protein